MEDYYKILGISDKTCSQEEIKKKYRKLALSHHPDKGGDEETFKNIAMAYDTLSDPQKRKQYDFGFNGLPDPMSFMFKNGMNQFFNMTRQKRDPFIPKKDHTHIIIQDNITMEEMFNGCNKEINVNRMIFCKLCKGIGCEKKEDMSECEKCKGSGTFRNVSSIGNMVSINTGMCSDCVGVGFKIINKCKECEGTGEIEETIKIPFIFPAGGTVEKHVINNMGHQVSSNSFTQIILILDIEMSNSKFKREGDDIVTRIHLTFKESILGVDTSIKYLDGNDIPIKMDGPIPPDKKFKIAGSGINGSGSLFIKFKSKWPNELPQEIKDVVEKLF